MNDLVALVVGTLLAVGALSLVIAPLFVGVRPRRSATPPRAVEDSGIRALREIEFDKATGKLSESDYATLKQEYGALAVKQMRAAPAVASVPQDPIEERVLAYRATHRECPTDGLRPESDAVYCSTCGTYLDGKCPQCGSMVKESAAGFCSSCGTQLAA